ncbi:MAG TPA: DUF805 domain-containing protein [Alphaproteobacteria bacterium]|nr:DUF805 domain-containing protein [Alphaproteobacteria bacterium]
MDNIVGLFTSTQGRISRKSWWLGVIILIVANLIISFLLLPLVGVSMIPNMGALVTPSGDVDAAALSQTITDSMRRSSWASLIVFVIFAYPGYALSVKRRHDKDNNGMDVLIYFALTAVVLLIGALGIGWETMTVGEVTIPTPSMWLNLLNLAVGIYALYLLVVLGFLKGTPGPNQYGPDPLAGTAAAAA